MSKYDKNILDIVDENDNIIGQETRTKIHKDGLLHREIHVWFFDDEKQVFLQHRKKDAETFPDLLDMTVGGHVEIGDNYITTALKEIEEETGIKVKKEDLIEVKKLIRESYDEITGLTNRAMGVTYAYRYNGSENDLKGEEDIGFEKWSIDELLNLKDEKVKKKFLPCIFNDWSIEILKKIEKI
jgi:isopentenyldiphosphate isomerase